MDDATLDRYAEAAWKLRCDRAAEARERPPATEPWSERAPFLKEIDRSVVSLVAAMAVHDAGLENTRRDAQLFALGAHRAAIFDALKIAIAAGGYEYERKRYRTALEALGGREEPS